jgi:hypothetical protein
LEKAAERVNVFRWLLLGLAMLAGGAMIAVFSLRFQSAEITGRIAPTTQTTGCEEESAFAVWRAAHDRPVYADTSKLPFASAYFNWLFYSSYGAALRPLLAAHGDASLHLYARRLTLAGGVFGSAVLIVFMFALTRGLGAEFAGTGIVVALSVFIGPLTSWWALTVRPDLWALAFETAGVVWFLMVDRRSATAAVAGAALLFFAAWSFKQTFIAPAAATGLFLFWRRRWRDAGLLAALFGLLVLAAFLALGPAYRTAITETVAATGFSIPVGLSNVLAAGVKMLPVLVAIPLALSTLRPTRAPSGRNLGRDALQLGLLGALLALIIAVPASFKGGAAVNYYFSLHLMLAIAAMAAIAMTRARVTPVLACGGLLLLSIATLAGKMGMTSLDRGAAEIAQRWEVWSQQPEPRFSADLRLNPPWLAHASPPLVLAFNYPFDRARGRSFEENGVGGLIERRYFATLLLPAYVRDSFDGANLTGYVRVQEVAGMALYRRVQIPRANPARASD